MTKTLDDIYRDIVNDPMNVEMKEKGYIPVYTAGYDAKIAIIGQAPGRKAQATMKPWNDASGILLRKWLGLSDEEFYDPNLVALTPMDFYYPGKGTHGDLPPRKGFAEKWHPKLFACMPKIQLTILVGAYAQKYYLHEARHQTLTQRVLDYEVYLPHFFPLVHPSPLNLNWRAKHPWFESEVVPQLRQRVAEILYDDTSTSRYTK